MALTYTALKRSVVVVNVATMASMSLQLRILKVKCMSSILPLRALISARFYSSDGMSIPTELRQVRPEDFKSIRYNVRDRVAHIELNRPERMNAIDYRMPFEIQAAVEEANLNSQVKVILLYGNRVFCAGYDLKMYAESPRGSNPCSQKMPWDPYLDYAFMGKSNECIMSLWRSNKPVVTKIRGVAIGGGSDMALSSDITFMARSARIGYPPSRVWGCPSTAMWVYRVGIERAKRILFTGDLLSAEEAARIGLIGEAVPDDELDAKVDAFIDRIINVPTNQLFFQKQVINNAIEMMGLFSSQRLATIFDGMTRHTPEGVSFQQRSAEVGFKQAVKERDSGQTASWSDMNKS